jgi:hypothetical protein
MTFDESIDSLVFVPQHHGGRCVVHRRALRILLGREPRPDESLRHAEENASAYEEAARAKISRVGLGHDAHFHLTSRDLRRAITSSGLSAR